MRVGFTSQNFRTITGHAGRTRRFLVFDLTEDGAATEIERLDLPVEMTMHQFHGTGPHPLDGLDVLVTKECGPDFRRRMARRGVSVVVSAEDTDPASVLRAIAEGRMDVSPPAVAVDDGEHDHGHHHHHAHRHENACRPSEAHEDGQDGGEHACCPDSNGNHDAAACGCHDHGHPHRRDDAHDQGHPGGRGHGHGHRCGGRGRSGRRPGGVGPGEAAPHRRVATR